MAAIDAIFGGMKRLVTQALVAVCAAGAVGSASVAGEAAPVALAGRLEARLAKAGVPAEELGFAVVRLGASPRPVFARGEGRSLIPASVAKVFTAVAALDLLGPAYVFHTGLSARGALARGVLKGDLVAHGTGDPNVSGRLTGGEPTEVLDALARRVSEAGVREITGDLVLDDGPFDREYVHPGWSDADRERWYGAPVAGLAFNDSCLDIVVRPAAQADARALLELPATSGSWSVQNLTATIEGRRHVVGATFSTAGEALQVRGTVALRGGPYTMQVPVPEPLSFFGGALRQRLEAQGVTLRGRVRPARDAADRAPGRMLGVQSSSLVDSLRVMNRRSQNFYAAQLFKAAGARHAGVGSWASGEAAVKEALVRRGLDDEGRTRIVDGSGLARENRTTAATLALLLAQVERDLLRGPLLHDSLAAPGEEGTLDDRLVTRHTQGRLRAKTGTLAQAGVHALAGYLEGRAGEPGLCFAVMVNKRSWKGDARGLIDDLVGILAAP